MKNLNRKNIIQYIKQTKNLPYEELINFDLGRTLTQDEIKAVKIWVEYSCDASLSSPYYDNAVRNLIISSDIGNIVRFSHKSLDELEDFQTTVRTLENRRKPLLNLQR